MLFRSREHTAPSPRPPIGRSFAPHRHSAASPSSAASPCAAGGARHSDGSAPAAVRPSAASGRLQVLSVDAALVLVIGVVSAGIGQLVQRKVTAPRQRIIEIIVHALMGMGLARAEIEADIIPRIEALVPEPHAKRS